MRELRRATAILRSASAFFAAELDRPSQPLIIDYVDQHKSEFGVEPICAALFNADIKIAPSTYYASKQRPPSTRAVHDEQLKVEITRACTPAREMVRGKRP